MIYSKLAGIYDTVMEHVNYDDWVELILGVVRRFGLPHTHEFFELGAGTGTLGARLRAKGFSYQGSDLSVPMCRQANRKGHRFVATDARFPGIRKRFDMVLFLYDGINYLSGLPEYKGLFEQVHRILKSGGLFLFDITTRYNSIRHFTDFLDFGDLENHFYQRRSTFDRESGIQSNHFVIFMRDSIEPARWTRHDEHHRQRVFSFGEIQACISPDLFHTVGVWDGFTFNRASSRSERVHFLLKSV